MRNAIFLDRVVLNNYRSIKECSVKLGPLTFLVGQNGAGKSNFLDALRLVTESLNTSLEHALRERGGVNEVRRRSSGRPTNFGIRLDWWLGSSRYGTYAIRVGAKPNGGFEVQRECCRVFETKDTGLPFQPVVPYSYEVKKGELRDSLFYDVENGALRDSSLAVAPRASSDRLYLVAASGLPQFRPLYDALSHMCFYNLSPDTIRKAQKSDPAAILARDGSNLASVLSLMAQEDNDSYLRLIEFLAAITPGIREVHVNHVGNWDVLEFVQAVGAELNSLKFTSENMSDGTLRALGVLTALFQSADGAAPSVPFVGIEEPEVAVHPGAAGVLRDALRAASELRQVAVTSHSPDLLDDKDISDTAILAVVNRDGETRLGPIDKGGRDSMRDRLCTAGELLRLDQMEPDEEALRTVTERELDLFSEYQA